MCVRVRGMRGTRRVCVCVSVHIFVQMAAAFGHVDEAFPRFPGNFSSANRANRPTFLRFCHAKHTFQVDDVESNSCFSSLRHKSIDPAYSYSTHPHTLKEFFCKVPDVN